MRVYRWIYAALALMLVCYALPLVVNSSAALSLNAYDLAEWASLHPAVRAQTPALLTTLLLRLPLVCMALLIAFGTRRGLAPALVVLVIAAALLPPEIVPFLSDNPNSRQQSALALIALLGGAAGLSGILPRQRRFIAAGIALIGAAASVIGAIQGNNLMRGFGLPSQIGWGGIALVLLFGLTALLLGYESNRVARATLKGTSDAG